MNHQPSSSSELIIGIDLGGTNMQFGLVDGSNGIVARSKKKTKATEGAEAVLDRLADGIHELCETHGCEMSDIGAIGIAAAGAIDIPRGVVLNAPNLRWYDLPLRDLLERRTRRPVVVENDVNGAVWGEYVLGAGRDCDGDLFGAWVGTGVGGGLVIGGRIYHGDMFTAGEFGHVVIDAGAPRGRALVEDICSRTGMSRMIVSRLHSFPKSVLHELIDAGAGVTGSKTLKKAIDADDPLALEVVSHAAEVLGKAIGAVVTMLSLKRVVVGGGITEALGEPYLDRVRASFHDWVFPTQLRACEIVPTRLLDDAGLLGAALLAREAIGQPAEFARC